jgi:hypothetical protein
MKKIRIKLLLTLLLSGIYFSCNNFLDKKDRNNISAETYYQTITEAITGVNSVYAGLQRAGLYHRQIHFVFDFSGGENAPTSNTQTPNQQLLNYTWDATHEHITALWNDSYVVIARANLLIDKVTKSPIPDGPVKSRVLAEARFLRALMYTNLVMNFGEVPLRTELNLSQTQLGGAPKTEIFTFIENDLKFAEQNLPKRSEYPAADLGRATSGAAKGLLGKVYVYQKKWADALTTLNEVITSNEYSLVANPRWNHNAENKNNAESLFEVQFTKNLNGGGGAWAVDQNTGWGGNGEGNFRPIEYGVDGHAFYNAKPSQALVDAFEPNDPRVGTSFFGPGSTIILSSSDPDYSPDNKYDGIFARAGYAWMKYQNQDLAAQGNREQDDGDINIRLLRYADILLLAAEANIESNNIAAAAGLINQVRRRADPSGAILPDRPTNATQAQMRDFLIKERQVELCGEGQRRVDIVRWGIAGQVLGSKFTANKHELFPKPATELDANKALKQNTGY